MPELIVNHILESIAESYAVRVLFNSPSKLFICKADLQVLVKSRPELVDGNKVMGLEVVLSQESEPRVT